MTRRGAGLTLRSLLVTLSLVLLLASPLFAQFTQAEIELIAEHLYMGLPQTFSSTQQILVRTAYVNCYDSTRRIGLWSAYHVVRDYLCKPERESSFKKYREDIEASGCPIPGEYERQYQSDAQKYDAGHLAPYNISGGDRDDDRQYACYRPKEADDGTGVEPCYCGDYTNPDDQPDTSSQDGGCVQYCGPSDPQDENTAFEINYLSNFAPQHESFNRWGLWRKLERIIQETWVKDRGMELWVVAGSVFTGTEPAKAGPWEDIHIPQLFFKLVVKLEQDEPLILAFLFPHEANGAGDIQDYLVTVDTIEALTGFDFFRDLPDDIEEAMESEGTWQNLTDFESE
ncbi:DNA/RNA non-specific endonuclease [Candidatus Bipolaricaulota bacterium]